MDVESSAMQELGLFNPKIAASPCRKVKIILKLKKNKIEDEVVPATSSSSENNSSMKLKFEATKRKLEQRYRDEAEKKAKKKIQRINIDDFPNPNNLRCCSSSSSKVVKAHNDIHGDVRERLLAKMRRMKKKNQKPKYSLYSRPDI